MRQSSYSGDFCTQYEYFCVIEYEVWDLAVRGVPSATSARYPLNFFVFCKLQCIKNINLLVNYNVFKISNERHRVLFSVVFTTPCLHALGTQRSFACTKGGHTFAMSLTVRGPPSLDLTKHQYEHAQEYWGQSGIATGERRGRSKRT